MTKAVIEYDSDWDDTRENFLKFSPNSNAIKLDQQMESNMTLLIKKLIGSIPLSG